MSNVSLHFMSIDLAPHIGALRNAVDAASVNFDIWWVYKSKDYRPQYVDTMNRYLGFFDTSIHAHFVAMLVALYLLYETRNDTFNVRRLLNVAESDSSFPRKELNESKVLAQAAKPIWIKVGRLRNEAFAHRTDGLSIPAIFKDVGITSNDLKGLIELSKKLLNTISLAFDGTEYAFNLSGSAPTLRLLEDLKAYHAG